MPLNKACAGKQYPPVTTEVTLEAIQKYARAYNDDNPRFFDPSLLGGIVAPPMFGVTVMLLSVVQIVTDPELYADLLRLLHRAQDMEFLGPIRPGDVITSTARIASIETWPTGETMDVELDARNQRGEAVLKTLFSAFIRGRKQTASVGKSCPAEAAKREPLFAVEQTIDKDQTFRYAEASGDRNPIHVDENVARMAGLPGTIVHGLCTMAFVSKVAIDRLCSKDPQRLKRLCAQFSRPVFPGQTITTKAWDKSERDQRRVYGYETYNPEAQAVIRGGVIEVGR
jgi:acyl dehydratase